jgi:hypothetical protein
LKQDGRPDPEKKDVEAGSYETFFTETGSGKYVPRSIFVDLDPSVGVATQYWLPQAAVLTSGYSPLTRSELARTASSSIQSF